MLKEYETRLDTAIKNFKKYQQKVFPNMTEYNDNGEWVFGTEFDDMCSAYIDTIKNVDADIASKTLVSHLLYIIARDSECSTLMDETLSKPQWFALLCRSSLQTDYINAKWQFAENLPLYPKKDNTQTLIYSFLADKDDYTNRMALKSLAEIYPEKVEEYAEIFWNKSSCNEYENIEFCNEYRKIMVLYVLNRIKSPKLKKYLVRAEKTDYKYLKNYQL